MKKIVTIIFAVMFAFYAEAQSSFDLRYEDATKYYRNGDYKTATELLQRALKSDNLTPLQKSQATLLLNSCQQEIEAARRLQFGRKNFDNLSYLGGKDSTYLNVASTNALRIVSSPSWVIPQVIEDLALFTIEENLSHEARTGVVEITLDKASTSYFYFSQQARPITSRMLNIHTEPGVVQLLVDNTMNTSPMSVMLSPGVHQIHARRNHFSSIDTTIVIEDDLNRDDIEMTLKLKREFATLTIDIKADNDEIDFISTATLTIDGKKVDLRPNIMGDYNDFKSIEFNTLYSDGTIPVLPIPHVIKITAPGYEDYEKILKNVWADKNYEIKAKLNPRVGFLQINDLYDAEGADIYIDDKIQKGVKVPCDSLVVTTGSHVVTFKKSGMISTAESYTIDVQEKKLSIIDLSMVGCDLYTFGGSLPVYATVSIDSVEIGKTPLIVSVTRGVHHLEIRKAGHLTLKEDFTAEGRNKTVLYEADMPETEHFLVKSDEDHLLIHIKQNKKTIVTGATTPSEVEIPISKKNYHIELTREGKTKTRVVYKGYFKFNDTKRNSRFFPSWSNYIFQFIEGQYAINGSSVMVFDKRYTMLGDASLFKFQLLKGLSTSVVRGKVFLADNNVDMHHSEGYALANSECKVLPAFSCLLINEEFRLGGAICSYVDVDVLASYTWYPNMSIFLPLSHVSGHDVFGGLEISSRFPVATLTLKLGYEALLGGQANVYDKRYSGRTKDQFVNTKMNFGQFIFGIGLSLSGKKSKGNNILRVF